MTAIPEVEDRQQLSQVSTALTERVDAEAAKRAGEALAAQWTAKKGV